MLQSLPTVFALFLFHLLTQITEKGIPAEGKVLGVVDTH